jgi:hypothetical protein
VRFEWDELKDFANQSNHGISFKEACSLFESGVRILEFYDQAHSDEEDRFISIGPIARGLVVVVWTERGEGVIRIISARSATRREERLFARSKERDHE